MDTPPKSTIKPKEPDTVRFDNQPNVSSFRKWSNHLKQEVAGASGRPDEAFAWFCEIDTTTDVETLQDSGSFPSLDAKVAAAFTKMLGRRDLGRQIIVAQEKAAIERKMLQGRQIACLIYKHFVVSETEGASLELEDLLNVQIKGDNLRAFLTEWELTLASLKQVPDEIFLETLLVRTLKNVDSLREQSLYTI